MSSSCRRFEGKIALVTGGAAGMGRATVHRLVDEGLEKIVIVERNDVDATFVGLMRFPGDRMAYIATGMESPMRRPWQR